MANTLVPDDDNWHKVGKWYVFYNNWLFHSRLEDDSSNDESRKFQILCDWWGGGDHETFTGHGIMRAGTTPGTWKAKIVDGKGCCRITANITKLF